MPSLPAKTIPTMLRETVEKIPNNPALGKESLGSHYKSINLTYHFPRVSDPDPPNPVRTSVFALIRIRFQSPDPRQKRSSEGALKLFVGRKLKNYD